MKSPQNKKLTFKSKLFVLAAILILAVGAATWAFLSSQKSHVNYAQETAAPIEKALADAGAVKMCGYGDDGRGVDSRAPDYGVTFKTSLNKDKAIEAVKQIASSNGYKLIQADSSYDYISSFFDHTSVQSAYPDLKAGPVLVGISIYSGGSNLSCPNKSLSYDANNVAIKMNISLPSFK